ncbi:MAG: SDR family oxidoreductase [Oscillospiraceae bacterium]|nr:SDR family oxidoreductase [Oscillospiraceae bacterium]
MIKTPPISSMSGAFDVKGKNVVVTGGNRGIGLGIVKAFAQSGANIAILCRNEESGLKVAKSLAEYGGKYTCIGVDISDYNSVSDASQGIYKFFEHVDVLVNNAGIGSTVDFFDPNGVDEWHRVIDTNLHGVANIVHTVVPKMKESGRGGTIINISSVGGQRVSNSRKFPHPPYNVSKAGVDIFTKYLAIALGDYGIRVNAISPAMTHSNLGKDLPASVVEMIDTTMPAHRLGDPLEIGSLCVFLASPSGVHITGTILVHDGGLMTVS